MQAESNTAAETKVAVCECVQQEKDCEVEKC